MSGLRHLLATWAALLLVALPTLAVEVAFAGTAKAECCPLAALMDQCPMEAGQSCAALQLSDCDRCCGVSSVPALPAAPSLATGLISRAQDQPAAMVVARVHTTADGVEARSDGVRLRLAEHRFAIGSSALLSIYLI